MKLLRYKVISYLGCAPNPLANNHKIDLLRKFIFGVIKVGDLGEVKLQRKIENCDVALIQGFIHENSARVPHLNFRKDILDHQTLNKGKHTLIADSNLFNYKVGTSHQLYYHRYSFDGVFPTTGNYFTDNHDPSRWKSIQKTLGVDLKDWRKNGTHILICTQRNGGWSMKGLDVYDWLIEVTNNIRQYSHRPIIIRTHPGDKKSIEYIKKFAKQDKWKCKFSRAKHLEEDLKNAWATVTYNSSPSVASAIEGIPTFVTDPTPQTSQAFEVANTTIDNLENPTLTDRQEWIEKLCMCHWNINEIEDGSAWRHIRQFI